MSTLTSAEVCKLTGLSYRQLDYYVLKGVVGPLRTTGQAQRREMRGSGSRRHWSSEDVPKLMVLARISAAFRGPGRETAGSTALFAEIMECWDRGVLDLGNGVAMIWEVPTWPST